MIYECMKGDHYLFILEHLSKKFIMKKKRKKFYSCSQNEKNKKKLERSSYNNSFSWII